MVDNQMIEACSRRQLLFNLSRVQLVKLGMFGVVNIGEGWYLKKCSDCGEIYATQDKDLDYCPEGGI